MKRTILICCILICSSALLLAGCSQERTYFHNRNGKVKHVRARRYPLWFDVQGRSHTKRTRHILKWWDRSQGY